MNRVNPIVFLITFCFAYLGLVIGFEYYPRTGQCYEFNDFYKDSVIYRLEGFGKNVRFKKYLYEYQKYTEESFAFTWTDYLKHKSNFRPSYCGYDKTFAYKSFSAKTRAVKVAIVDTGIKAPNRPEFKIKEENKKIFKSRKFAGIPDQTLDTRYLGHANIIADMLYRFESNNKNVTKLDYAVEIFDYNVYPFGDNSDAVESSVSAFGAAIRDQVKVINYSSSGWTSSVREYMALKELEKNGIIVVVAAGNDRWNLNQMPMYPCSYKDLSNVICVGAYVESGNNQITLSAFSNYIHNEKTPNFIFAQSRDQSTSFAAPNITKMIAAIWGQNPELTYKEVLDKIPRVNKLSNIGILTVIDEDKFLNQLK